ncbi:DNA helicase-2/ATP-dependent DNA helicase PcrA [Amycolatopsis bartoniae]|uniref:DNA 3'-5' helicase n=1 Tax=Amycolatopsis bartoniae TaxID=941986 RepID=A0A8H9M7U3_9PSEU|nr:ATP-dependent DNA helicase [Amycolatopsis bartoniae]MBB2938871.1 DNA helicase-2/ATP-dependent DNA helicase PcrA [Amycolatopsis bartoniae]TVT00682.1 ATP-dependent helicase [Amycolatopsis bartoniae]GHF77245.1 ATP-dependent DNA helicase [Amycolatopsis bartoniae]
MTRVSPAELAAALGLHPPTPEQAAVIAAPVEPALVVAGAGAGKTETMAARVVWLVANGVVTPERVLGLTFTRKAARQLAERVRARLRRLAGSGLLDRVDPGGGLRTAVAAGEPTVLTYHAYAGRLLSEHGLRLPVQPGVRLLSETSSWQLAHRVVSTWDGDLDTDRVPASVTAQLLALAGELGEHLVTEQQLADYSKWLCDLIETAPRAKGQRAALPKALGEIAAAQRFRLSLIPLIESYHRRKRAEGALDFADQMSLAAQLASDHAEVAGGERDRYGAVLLDEYQDTGHAQRILLRSLFGGVENLPLPVTAVGDPAQAIYGWRGASAANLPRFTTDFPRRDGDRLAPAREYGLLTSFRNPPEVLTLANGMAEPLRARGLGVARLRARDGAGPADIEYALLRDIRAEREWVADALARRWFAHLDANGSPPTAAVLVRRRADMAPIAAELRARDLPVEVVGLGGLLDEPEVADLVATLRVLADPLAGTAAARLLTGARWRLSASDLAALWRRANEIAAPPPTAESTVDELFVERAEQTGLVDALDDPGDPARYSADGYERIRRIAAELSGLRRRLDQSLPELVADVERTMLLDVESLARPGGAGRAHLDAFADVVADFAETSPDATLMSFVDYLLTAAHAEDGLTPGEVEVLPDRVQVLTAHAAKGLEWQVVAVPHLSKDVFPNKRRSSSWLRTVTSLPAHLRGDSQDLPKLQVSSGMDRKEITEAFEIHEQSFAEREAEEERRLCYVALTRSEHALVVSGHWWNETSSRPKGPSDFLLELAEMGVGTRAVWADEPPEDEENPLVTQSRTARWPVDPLGGRRDAVAEGVRMVLAAMDAEPVDEQDDPDGWIADTDVLLAERAANAGAGEEVTLPGHLSVSQLVELAADPGGLARRLRRPLPVPPNTFARRGTAFHGWLERRFEGERLLELEDLPGAADEDAAPDEALDELRAAFEASSWAVRTPHEVEVPFSTEIDGVLVRGRMDAVFADPDGGWTVVDWKTGAVPEPARLRSLSVQLAAYRLAWASLSGTPLEKVRAAFHYVREDATLRPVDLLDADGLRDLLRSVPEG